MASDVVHGRCQLCHTTAPLRESHVIPAFVMRWLKESSSGGMRNSAQPNLRVQDGPKEQYLCDHCEQRFGRWERKFAERIFTPLHDESRIPPLVYPYHTWLMKFAVSLSWRVLLHNRETRGFDDLSDAVRKAVGEAFEVWRLYLLDERAHPAPFEQHLLPLGLIDEAPSPITSTFFNRYATRTVDHDLPHTDDSLMVFTKLGKLAFFGFVLNCRNSQWQGTRLNSRNGSFSPSSTFAVPAGVLAYLSREADVAASGLAGMSERQRQKVQRSLAQRPPSAESLRAFERDVEVFGGAARLVTKPETPNDEKP